MLKTHLEHITLIETVLLNSCWLKYNPLVIYSNTTTTSLERFIYSRIKIYVNIKTISVQWKYLVFELMF